MEWYEPFARDLHELGVTVVPVMDDSSRKHWERELFKAMDEFPEFKVKGREVQRVLGGFGALGNPSSFHHFVVRQFRRKMKRLFAHPLLREFVKLRFPEHYASIRLEALFDRLCVRKQSFREPTAEQWHRDIYSSEKYNLRLLPSTLPTDTTRSDGGGASLPSLYRLLETTQDMIFGGWVNMDHRTQHFVCLPGTQDSSIGSGDGFSTFSAADVKKYRFNEQLAAQANQRIGHSLVCNEDGNVVVPPGHALLFFQRLIHSVKGGPQPETASLRVFHGFRLTCERTSLFDIREVVDNGGVPRIPSGQMPPMYSANHYAFFNDPSNPYWREWGHTHFRPECLFQRKRSDAGGGGGSYYYTPGSKDDRNKASNKGRYMPSLSEMGLWNESFRYSADEERALLPQPLFRS